MKKFLSVIGKVLAVGMQLATGFPLVQGLFGTGKAGQAASTVVNDFTLIGKTIILIETALQGKTGPEKLAAASVLVKQILLTSEAVTGHRIANEPEFNAAAVDITNGVVRMLNSLSPDSIKTAGKESTAIAEVAVPSPAQPAPPRKDGI